MLQKKAPSVPCDTVDNATLLVAAGQLTSVLIERGNSERVARAGLSCVSHIREKCFDVTAKGNNTNNTFCLSPT